MRQLARALLVLVLLLSTAVADPVRSMVSSPDPSESVTDTSLGGPAEQDARSGFTIEVAMGGGYSVDRQDASNSGAGLASGVGLGGWLTPNLALTGRIAGMIRREDGQPAPSGFIGPNVQYWLHDRFWVAGGVGLATVGMADEHGHAAQRFGVGGDVRAGAAFRSGTHDIWNVSLEVTPNLYREMGASWLNTGVALLIGYQQL